MFLEILLLNTINSEEKDDPTLFEALEKRVRILEDSQNNGCQRIQVIATEVKRLKDRVGSLEKQKREQSLAGGAIASPALVESYNLDERDVKNAIENIIDKTVSRLNSVGEERFLSGDDAVRAKQSLSDAFLAINIRLRDAERKSGTQSSAFIILKDAQSSLTDLSRDIAEQDTTTP